ncbi:DUF2948 family protein [Pseudogemmobacter humi]|uniref:DUF2948 domain-containing protein n=1 Tax=Pseudogemmobacter humi TaxID=2483812 RepID=A0A3P5XDY9_9RHOB|nr:DUF2948 family protein [Pseudogemmobacter humi]VDC26761.1 hypothetical protein XINFAN_01752 [Pseudogemmobacter humi]
MADARYEDGSTGPLYLTAVTAEDALVISALLQDAVLTAADLHYDRRRRRFTALVNRLRREDRTPAPERVRSLFSVMDVLAVQSQGIAPGDTDQVLSVLSVAWEPGEEGAGQLTLILAGDGAIRLGAEALELHLEDVSRPYVAPSRKLPDHGA